MIQFGIKASAAEMDGFTLGGKAFSNTGKMPVLPRCHANCDIMLERAFLR
jgi:hypothetical protein